MNILLFNSNPVVNKLVTLSAQKTSNTLDSVHSMDEIESKAYDLLIIDDELYSEEVMEELASRVEYKKSLYICSKDAKPVQEFTKTLKKPFLPTDLVELLISLSKEVNVPQFDLLEDDFSSDKLDDTQDTDSFDFDELDSLDEEIEGTNRSKFDDFDAQEDIEFDNLDDELLEDEAGFDDTDIEPSSKATEGVLDKEELQEVQNLLDETETDDEDMFGDFELEDDLNLEEDEKKPKSAEDYALEDDDFSFDEMEDEESLGDLADDVAKTSILEEDDFDLEDEEDAMQQTQVSALDEDDDFSFDETEEEMKEDELSFDEAEEEIKEDELSFDETEEDEPLDKGVVEASKDDDFSFDEMSDDLLGEDISEVEETQASTKEDLDDETALEEYSFDEESDELEDLESQIDSAVKELSDEDLESEVDEDMLLDIDSLTSRDLKLAIGEEVDDDEEFTQPSDEVFEENALEEDMQEKKSVIHEAEENSSNDGVEALKKLLKALSNEDVAASLKGMKININITLGDNQ